MRKYLRRRGVPYRQRVANCRSRFRVPAPEKRSIDLRPLQVERREEFGDWEIDTIHSRRNGLGAVLTLIERKSRYRCYFLLKDLKAETTIKVLLPFFQNLPAQLRRSLTSDNGSEFAVSELSKLEKVCKGLEVYYCHPFRACERGALEHANGELRWYLPKGTDFSTVSKEQLQCFEQKINNRPMKVLQWQSAQEVFGEVLKMAA